MSILHLPSRTEPSLYPSHWRPRPLPQAHIQNSKTLSNQKESVLKEIKAAALHLPGRGRVLLGISVLLTCLRGSIADSPHAGVTSNLYSFYQWAPPRQCTGKGASTCACCVCSNINSRNSRRTLYTDYRTICVCAWITSSSSGSGSST